jgi:hypothetical protein
MSAMTDPAPGEAPDDDAPPREFIADTWCWKADAATWIANLASPGGDAMTANGWLADLVAGVLGDFTPLVRVHSARLLGDGPVHLAWHEGERYATFRGRLLDAIRAYPTPLSEVELSLDLRVWVHTADSPARPVFAWVRYPKIALLFQIDTHDSLATVAFDLTNTLFCAFTYPDKEPNPLYSLNEPLLEDALHHLRARSDDELTRTGELKGKHEFGFSPDRDDY